MSKESEPKKVDSYYIHSPLFIFKQTPLASNIPVSVARVANIPNYVMLSQGSRAWRVYTSFEQAEELVAFHNLRVVLGLPSKVFRVLSSDDKLEIVYKNSL